MQNYYISSDFATQTAQKNLLTLRNAMRLYCFLKTHGHLSSLYISELRKVCLPYFHYKQIKKYLSILEENGWIGRDNHGKVFLRGRKTALKLYGGKKKFSGIEVTPDVCESNSAWTNFISACQVTVSAKLLSHVSGQRLRYASTSNREGDAEAQTDDQEVPVSLENMMNILGVSQSTASRIRIRASRSGLVTNRQVLVPIGAEIGVYSRSQLMRFRGDMAEYCDPYRDRYRRFFDHAPDRLEQPASMFVFDANGISVNLSDGPSTKPYLAPNPDALIWKDGQAWMQRPNMISTSLFIRKYKA